MRERYEASSPALMNFKTGSQEDEEVSGVEQQAAFYTMKKSLAHAKKIAYFDRNSEETIEARFRCPVELRSVLLRLQVQGVIEQGCITASLSR